MAGKHKAVLQFNLDETFVKEWKSATEIERETKGEFRRKFIYRCVEGGYGRKSYKNYIWRYKISESV